MVKRNTDIVFILIFFFSFGGNVKRWLDLPSLVS